MDMLRAAGLTEEQQIAVDAAFQEMLTSSRSREQPSMNFTKLDAKLGRPPVLAADGKNFDDFSFKLKSYTAVFSSTCSSSMDEIEMNPEKDL
eukprot:44846-Amphidinium_carterae.1